MVIQRSYNRYTTMRREMLSDSVRWIDWALANPDRVPRIPRVRVDSGIRFSERFKVAYWSTVVQKLDNYPYPWDE